MKSLVLLLMCSSIYAAQYCNELAKAEPWKQGGFKGPIVKDIVNEFPESQKNLVNFLDNLPIEFSEKQLVNHIKDKTTAPVIRIRQDSPRFQWEITKGGSTIGIVIHYYKGCVSQMMLMDVKSSKVYFRDTFLPSKKL